MEAALMVDLREYLVLLVLLTKYAISLSKLYILAYSFNGQSYCDIL